MSDQFGLPADAIKQLCNLFSRYSQIDAVILYGSRAKGNFRDGSDIDLTITGSNLDLSLLLTIETEIDDLLLPWSVDLSLLHNIDNTELIDHIARVGIPIYKKATP